jgi:GTPase
MAFIDELKVHIKAGKGGDGVVRWRREKFIARGGPAGGDGGDGGDVYIQGAKDSALLQRYQHTNEFNAVNGEDGRKRSEHGANGEDLVIDLPIGSFVTNLDNGREYELLEEGQKVLILKGGEGGLGNERFKSSTNQSPEQWTPGKAGHGADFHIELRLFADFGLIGLPCVGKSSLLNAITNAHSKVGEFNFTTLDPHLGDLYGTIIADIPGLIEGASKGKGLGHKFLRHIRRTKVLLHCLSAESENIERDYKVIRKELGDFDKELIEKEEVILVTKMDMEDSAPKLEKVQKMFEDKTVLGVSILDDGLIEDLKKFISSS